MSHIASAIADGLGKTSIERILVMDDEKYYQRLFQVHLEREGYAVLLAGNGQEALNKIADERIDLAILDVSMPAPNGFDILAQIRSVPSLSRLRVILKFGDGWQRASPGVNSYIELEKARALEAGVNGVIAIPFAPLELLNMIKRL